MLGTAGPRTSLDVVLSDTETALLRSWIASGQPGAALATAHPGSGLTTLVGLLVREMGLDAAWVTPGQAGARELLSQALQSGTSVSGRQKLVVLDEYDQGEDQGLDATGAIKRAARGAQLLCLSHAVSCSARQRADVCRRFGGRVFAFPRPSPARLFGPCRAACPPSVPDDAVRAACVAARGDIRSALRALGFLARAAPAAAPTTTTFAKDERMDAREAVVLVLDSTRQASASLGDAIRGACGEPGVAAMGVFENYLGSGPTLHAAAQAADAMSAADVVDAHVARRVAWDDSVLVGTHAALALAAPAMALDGRAPAKLPDKVGGVWSKEFNRHARARLLREVSFRRLEQNLQPFSAADVSMVVALPHGPAVLGYTQPAAAKRLQRLRFRS